MTTSKKALVIVNIGTPESPQPEDVGVYLEEFLMDPDVITLPGWMRWILVKKLIVPKRKFQSAEAYQKIWTDQGSPLAVYMKSLAEKMDALSDEWEVHYAMRYGKPSIHDVLEPLKNHQEVLVVPLFPQWADATNLSVIKEAEKAWKKIGAEKPLNFSGDFYQDDAFIKPAARLAREKAAQDADYVLMSFHGLPESQIIKGDQSRSHCLKEKNCCSEINAVNRKCYRAQCYATARALAHELRLRENQYGVSFQSRLGPSKWIQPYTDEVIKELAGKGVKNLAVLCPAFVMDCLETLEEIAIGIKEQFIEAGGESFTLVPCVNDDAEWAERFFKYLTK